METIGKQELWSYVGQSSKAKKTTSLKLRGGSGHRVSSYLDLATKVAELQFLNRDHVLLFRGQSGDYRNTADRTTLKPSLFRSRAGVAQNPNQSELTRRFELLKQAERDLAARYEAAGMPGYERLKRQRIMRWAILQHYEVCATPLLDVSHSLRIAASFASSDTTGDAFVFVLGVPNLSGAITASAEAGLQIVRLSSVCPPTALRPHVQEGYLLGEYPDMTGYDQKQNYLHYEIDFGRRLVAKFRFTPEDFWNGGDFPKVGKRAVSVCRR